MVTLMIMKLCNNDNYREGHAMIRSLQTYGAACTLKLSAALIKQDVEIKKITWQDFKIHDR